MTALPPSTDFTGSLVNEAGFKTAITGLRGFLAGLFGEDGLAATALSTIGALGGKIAAKTAAYTVLAADRGTVFHCSGTWTLSVTASATLGSGHSFAVINTGTGAITIDPNSAELIDGAATKVLTAGQSCIVTCNGTGFYAISGGGGDSDTVDGIHASTTAMANKLLALDATAKLPASITGNAPTADTATTVASASISQSKLKTTTGSVSTTSTTLAILTLPGGEYGFYPQIKMANTNQHQVEAQILNGNVVNWTTYTAKITMLNGGGDAIYAQQRYVQASPPYDLGDGKIPLFVFALVDKNGDVLAMYSAPEAPWHNNGPTSICPDFYNPDGTRFKRILRVDLLPEDLFHCPVDEQYEYVEISQVVKQADMPLIPHPFMGNDLTGLTVVLIDPVSDHTHRAAEVFCDRHDEHHDLYYKNKLVIDNAALKRNGPPGVMVAGVRWKNSK